MEPKKFQISNYDCIGFDLDNTLAKFKLTEMIDLEYKVLSEFLVNRGYSRKHLMKPLDYDFIAKGLILDIEKGNILKISGEGKILIATHGTKLLKTEEIELYYPGGYWDAAELLSKSPMETWNGPLSEKIRSLQDNFDTVISLVFGRLIDSLDEAMGGPSKRYSVYTDIYEGLVDMFTIQHFNLNKGNYYPELKYNAEKYYYKRSEKLTTWLKKLKSEGKRLFLVTGSYIDFAELTASNTLGPNWRDYFDIIITYAKKPGFFNLTRDFIGLDGYEKIGPVPSEDLKLGEIYANGNWNALQNLLSRNLPRADPKFLYIGDAIIQDVYAPKIYVGCDTVAICPELRAKEISNKEPDGKIIYSSFWGSYFHHNGTDTIWSKFIKTYANICLPDVEYLVNL